MPKAQKILLHYAFPERLGPEISERFPDIELMQCSSCEGLASALHAFTPDICFSIREVGKSDIIRNALMNANSLKWIANGGSGTDHLGAWDPKKLTVTNSAGAASDVMAQYVIGAVFSFNMNFPQFCADKIARRWRSEASVSDLTTKSILIIGLGKIGQSIARLARRVGLRVVSVDVNPEPPVCVDQHVTPKMLLSVVNDADFVTVCVPSNSSTRGMIDASVLQAMKPDAVFINVGRGDLVDEKALFAALKERSIKGAALDVFATEPLATDSPLWGLDNVMLSPHCSSVFDGWERNAIRMFCNNIERWQANLPLQNVVDPLENSLQNGARNDET